MSNFIYIKAFNDLLDQFYEYLSNKFPVIAPDILVAKTFTDFVRRGSPKEVIRQFMEHTRPYTTQIMDCDEGFFLDYEKNLRIENGQDILMYAPKLKKVWISPETSDMEKAQIWLYFHKLIQLGRNSLA